MINYIVFLFLVLSIIFEELFDIFSMLAFNLPIIAVSRAVFIVAYYLNYFKYANREENEEKYVISTQEKLYFIGKNAAVILLGFLNFYLAIFFAVYSLLVASVYFKNVGAQKENVKFSYLGKGIYGAVPIGFFLWIYFLGDLFALVPLILSVLLFFYWGKTYGDLSKEELYQRYQNRIFKRIPASVQYLIILVLVVPPIVVFTGLYIWNLYFFQNLAPFAAYVFDPMLMFLWNLPLVVLSRILVFHSLKEDYELTKENALNLTNKRKAYFLTKNIVMILVGFLLIFAALFIFVYSCLIAIVHYSNLYERKKIDKYKIIRIICFVFLIVGGTFTVIFYFDLIGIIYMAIAGALAGLLFFYKGRKIGQFTLAQLKGNLNQRFRKSPQVLKFFLIAFVIVVPTTLIIGTYTVGTPLKETYMIKMEDGTKLATDVYYSPLVGKNPAPVVLIRTPYGKDGFSEMYRLLYLPQGYHCVVQDFRGCHDSDVEEDFLLFTKAYTDGIDTIEWILDKEWCDGKIGSAGASALAINQYFYAGMKDAYDGDDGLRCQSLWFGCPDLYLDAIMEGAYHESSVETWVKSTADINWRYQVNTILDLIEAEDIKSELYNATTLSQGENVFENVEARAIHVGGWYDHFLAGTLRGYIGYDDNGAKRARDHQLMVIGPWTHGAVYGMQQGHLTYPDNSNGIPLLLDWEQKLFEESLLGIEHDDLWEGDRVAYYLMGDVDDPDCDANYWKFAEDWPLDYKWEKWYLGEDKDGDHVIVDDSDDLAGASNISYIYDPADPVITRGGNNQPGFDTAGPMDQRLVENDEDGKLRDDVLLFKSEELDKAVTFEGELKARLHIKSSCNDTDFMLKLVDIYPDGRRMLIIDSALTTRFRTGFFTPELMTPDTEYNITIDLWGTAYQFNKGHRIGVVITSSNYDRYAINPNTGGPIGKVHYSSGLKANNTIITGPGKSCIFFPKLND